MSVIAIKPATRPFPLASVTYRAWRIGDTDAFGNPFSQAIPVGEPETLKDALAQALVYGGLCHKDRLAIRETGVRLRQWASGAEEVPFDRVHLFQIKRKSQPRYEGAFRERRVHDLYAEAVAVLPGAVFA